MQVHATSSKDRPKVGSLMPYFYPYTNLDNYDGVVVVVIVVRSLATVTISTSSSTGHDTLIKRAYSLAQAIDGNAGTDMYSIIHWK